MRKEKWRRVVEATSSSSRVRRREGTTLSQIPREIPAAFFVLHQALSRMHIRRGRRLVNSFPRKISSASKRILRQILYVATATAAAVAATAAWRWRVYRRCTAPRRAASTRPDNNRERSLPLFWFSFYFTDTRPPTRTPANKTSNPTMNRA